MTSQLPSPDLTDLVGTLAPPRRNGELVFETPWESRAFGLAVALSHGGAFDWQEFRAALAAELADAPQPETSTDYYAHWLAAFERVALAHGLLTPDELATKAAEIAAHDEHGDHDHDRH